MQLLNAIDMLSVFTRVIAPPGAEDAMREALQEHVRSLGYTPETDTKGNLLVMLPGYSGNRPQLLVTAHLDEIALLEIMHRNSIKELARLGTALVMAVTHDDAG